VDGLEVLEQLDRSPATRWAVSVFLCSFSSANEVRAVSSQWIKQQKLAVQINV
jgi:hypothetical protein